MNKINIFKEAGKFAENKDVARDIRVEKLIPALEKNQNIVLNFEGVDTTTQSFIHALISDAIRQYGNDALDKITFHRCNDTIQQLVKIVIEYTEEGMREE